RRRQLVLAQPGRLPHQPCGGRNGHRDRHGQPGRRSTSYWISIFDQTTGAEVVICGFGTSCSGSVSQPGPTQHSYIAYVDGFGSTLPPPHVRATSNTAAV